MTSHMQAEATSAQLEPSHAALFPYSFDRTYPVAVRSSGIYIFDEHGQRYLDGSGGPAAISVGHSVPEIAEQIARASSTLSYAHSSQFHTRAAIQLAELLAARFPGNERGATRVLFTSGGSESTETAIKVARQYWLARGQPSRRYFISRQRSYHGATLGALALSGNVARRTPYLPLLGPASHIADCYCYRCPLQKTYPACELACAQALEAEIMRLGPENVAGLVFEPVVGATSGAVPTPGYVACLRAICERYGVLLIADEVMTGCGRTGRYFAVEHWDVTPDIIVMGKGLASGYAPLGAVLLRSTVASILEDARIFLNHSFTYQCHHISVAAGLAVQNYINEHGLVARAREMGEYMMQAVDALRDVPAIGEVRGLGLMWTAEFVEDRPLRRPFPAARRFAEAVFAAARQNGLLVYPGRGSVDGTLGDHVLLAPPLIIEKHEIDFIIETLGSAVRQVASQR